MSAGAVQFGLFDDFDPRAKYRSSDPLTSKNAAFANIPNRATQKHKLMLIHLEHPLGLTNDELHNLTPMCNDSLTTRISELVDGKWLEDSGLTRKSRWGIEQIVWRVTDKAFKAREDGLI